MGGREGGREGGYYKTETKFLHGKKGKTLNAQVNLEKRKSQRFMTSLQRPSYVT